MRYDHPITSKPLFITKPIQPLLAYSSTPRLPPRPHSRTSSDGSPGIGPPQLNNINTRMQRPPGASYSASLDNSPESITSATAVVPSYLFGVFKSTADGSSLDHIASTTTLRRGRSTAGRQSFTTDGVASDVTALPSSRSPIKPRPGPRRQDDSTVEAMGASSQAAPLASYSSFMLSDPPPTANRNHQRTIVIGDQDSGPQEDHSKAGEKGRVHECPHCCKRFNRPSSLQIHANTHTGARRKFNSSMWVVICSCLSLA